jgi:acetyl-CoA carboxylase carboxyltransferase component
MGGEQASNVLVQDKRDQLLAQGKELSPEEEEEIRRPVLEKYEREGSPYYATARLWDDGVIDPLDTRTALALGISMALNSPIPNYQPGVFRM